MRYILDEEILIFKSGFFKMTIPYNTIYMISRPINNKYKGIRTLGVALPGYYAGRFKLFLDGKFESVRLFATKLNNLIFINVKNNKGKDLFIGITPEDSIGFISRIKVKQSTIQENQVDPKKPLIQDEKESRKNERRTIIIYRLTLSIILISVIMLFLFYPFLPEIIPIHYNIYGIPDAWGHKYVFLAMFVILYLFELVLSLLFFHLFLKKSELRKTKYGYIIMIFIAFVCLLFFIVAFFSLITSIS
ncbi:MAG: PH domain-containing protein [Promethearchaeota archaeon]